MMKKVFLILIIIIISVLFSKAQIPTFQWVKPIGDIGEDQAHGLALDGVGNVYCSGWFEGVVDFDPGPATYTLSSVGASDAFITKLDQAGNFVWAKSFGGLQLDAGYEISIDDSGYVYAIGEFEGLADFDPGPASYTLAGNGNADVFICKFDTAGNFIWAKGFGGTSIDRGASITTDRAGNIYAVGYFVGAVDFDPGPAIYNLTSAVWIDAFVIKLSKSGNFVWAKALGGNGSDYAWSVKLDENADVYIGGVYDGVADFDPGPSSYTLTPIFSSFGNVDAYLTKLDSSGNFIFAKGFGDVNDEYCFAVNIDKVGNIYIGGAYGDMADLDPGPSTYTLNAGGYGDIFITKLDSLGNFKWAKGIGGKSYDGAYALAFDSFDNIYVTGIFVDTVDFDPGPAVNNLYGTGKDEIFILKLDPSGNFMWAKNMGGPGLSEAGFAIEIDAVGSVYTVGRFMSTVDFDPDLGIFNVSANGMIDCFIHKLGQSPTAIKSLEENIIKQKIYPNPNEGMFSVELKTNSKITITNVFGEEILRETLTEGKQNLDIKNQANGIYFVKITDIKNETSEVKKIIKQ